jgi:hypothetical protein
MFILPFLFLNSMCCLKYVLPFEFGMDFIANSATLLKRLR